ncbi:hypothetical protein J6590_058695 [Homalodisca vitripennis]|nr:hypothetical protein J6590_058695 [Homalodisca vitripennis]
MKYHPSKKPTNLSEKFVKHIVPDHVPQAEEISKHIYLKGHKASDRYFIIPHMLSYDTKYNFTLKVWTNLYDGLNYTTVANQSRFANVEVEVFGENEMVPYDIEIICATNCGVKVLPNTILFLKAKEKNNLYDGLEFTWSYSKDNGTAQSLDSIKEQNLPDFMLIIKDNSLDGGVEYNVLLEGKKRMDFSGI